MSTRWLPRVSEMPQECATTVRSSATAHPPWAATAFHVPDRVIRGSSHPMFAGPPDVLGFEKRSMPLTKRRGHQRRRSIGSSTLQRDQWAVRRVADQARVHDANTQMPVQTQREHGRGPSAHVARAAPGDIDREAARERIRRVTPKYSFM